MNFHLTTRLSRMTGLIRIIARVVCFGAVILLGVSECWATCGDYLHSKNMRGHQPMRHDQNPSSQYDVSTAHRDPASVPLRTPCNGPQCQNRDPSPMAPGPVPVNVVARSTTEALLTPTTELNLVRRGVAYHEAAVSASEGCVDPLDRPPRA